MTDGSSDAHVARSAHAGAVLGVTFGTARCVALPASARMLTRAAYCPTRSTMQREVFNTPGRGMVDT
eukprot:254171-Chlamydomonas_euryale.AAC.3